MVPLAFDDFIKKTKEIEVLDSDDSNPSQPAVSAGL